MHFQKAEKQNAGTDAGCHGNYGCFENIFYFQSSGYLSRQENGIADEGPGYNRWT
jgi:hypothetical protein